MTVVEHNPTAACRQYKDMIPTTAEETDSNVQQHICGPDDLMLHKIHKIKLLPASC